MPHRSLPSPVLIIALCKHEEYQIGSSDVCMISGTCCYKNEIFTLLGCYATLTDKLVTDILGQPISPILKGQGMGLLDPRRWHQ